MHPSFLCACLAWALLCLSAVDKADAKNRPTVSDAQGCFDDPEADKGGFGGDILYCCYDDGCYICGGKGEPITSCVWDSKYSSRSFPHKGPIVTSPGSPKKPKLPRDFDSPALNPQIGE